MRTIVTATIFGALALAGCSGGGTATNETVAETNVSEGNLAEPMGTNPETAVAMLKMADGKAAGRATAAATGSGIDVTVQVEGLPAGPHGAHVHTVGKCEGPKFESAGAHWNPGDKKHGLENPAGPHAGDMPNLTVAADGTGSLTFTLPGGTFAELFDADGSAMMIHQGPDDMKTDPSGESGGRIACGVFERG
jgi:superoxide dismutase, Cu-Zn family